MICLLRTFRPFGIPAALALSMAALPVWGQTPPAVEHATPSDHASAYYNYSMGHLYAEMAQAYSRTDYVNKAIDFYRLALKQDPSISFITEELTDLYIQSNQLRQAVTEAEDLLKQNPDDLGARRILGRVYTRMIGDPQAGKVDEKMLHLAIEQYSKIAEKDPEDLESQLLLARLDRLAHDTVAAEKVYKDILAKESDNDEALTGLAAIFSDRGDSKNAIDMLKRASDSNPGARTLVMLASLYEQINDYGSAADAWERALQLAPENDRWKRALAQDLLYANRIDEALKLYEGIGAEDPKDSQIQLRLAEIYLQKRDFAKSRTALNAAKAEDGGSIEVKFEEVMLLDAEGKPEDAIKALKSLIDETAKTEYTPAERAQRNRLEENLGMLYRTAGKFAPAIASFKEIVSDDAEISARAEIQIVETWREAKDMPAARKEADAALKKFPKDRLVVVEHATLVADSGKVEQAIGEIEALKDGKNDRKILLSEAQIYDKAKRFGDEQKSLDAAQKLSTEKAEIVEVRFARGAMLERMKDFEGSEAEFRAIVKDDPTNAGALNYLGYMLADRNTRLDEAQQLIAKALELDPQNGAYLDSLGWVYYRQNRLDAAEDQLRRALDKMGNDPTVHDHLGDVLLKQGKVKEAIAQWQSSLKNYDSNAAGSDVDPADMAKVQRKLEDARVRVAQQGHASEAH